MSAYLIANRKRFEEDACQKRKSVLIPLVTVWCPETRSTAVSIATIPPIPWRSPVTATTRAVRWALQRFPPRPPRLGWLGIEAYNAAVTYFAHSHKEKPVSEWHPLDQHLRSTAARAERFAAPFAKGWGWLAGLWHDAGKYQKAFQDYLAATGDHTGPKVDHSSVGALIAWEKRVAPAAFVVAGHHGGLSNKQDLRDRMKNKHELLDRARESGLPASLENVNIPADPSGLSETARTLWIRFPCFQPWLMPTISTRSRSSRIASEKSLPWILRRCPPASTHSLTRRVCRVTPTPVNLLRRRVLEACRVASCLPRGLFSLTVPTGGGKTLSSLSFALRHAVEHGLRRVIFVVPFTSIIDQTAKTYRDILGDDAVVEHHSNMDPDKETPANQTACENWDGTIIVTTSVQFFESLYANRTSRCRKLHRIADSVVVFDEVQTFEPSLLEPIKEGLRNLVRHFGVSAVFCTATQPPLGLGAREIVKNVASEFDIVRDRCRFRMPESPDPMDWEQLSLELRTERQALAIVDRRADAEELARLTGESCIHLSARMCPAHRLETIARI